LISTVLLLYAIPQKKNITTLEVSVPDSTQYTFKKSTWHKWCQGLNIH